MPGQQKRAIFVLGMHRSGTSAMAKVLGLCGFTLPLRLMKANYANPAGYWEPLDAANLDDAVLADLDSSWSDAFGPRHHRRRRLHTPEHLISARKVLSENYADQDLIVFKEPRATLLVDLWRSAAVEEGFEPHFVIMVRHPLAVAQSLAARDGVSRNRALILWATYMLAAETATRRDKRTFVGFDELIAGPEAVLDKLEAAFGFAFPRRTWGAANEIDVYLKPELVHHRPADGLGGAQFGPLEAFHAFLEGSARGEKSNADVPGEVAAWLEGLEETVGPVLKQAETSASLANAADLGALRQEVADLKAQLQHEAAAAADGQTRLAAAMARAAAVASAYAQRRADLIAERDAANQKAADLQRDLIAKLEESSGQTESARERIIALEGEVEMLRRRGGIEESNLRARQASDEERSRLSRVLDEVIAEQQATADRVTSLQTQYADAQRLARNARRAFGRRLIRARAAADGAERESLDLKAALDGERAEAQHRATADSSRIAILEADARQSRAQSQQRIEELSTLLEKANGRPIGELQGLVLKRAARIVRRRLGFSAHRT